MAPDTSPAENLAELLDQLGGIPPHRIRARPAPGTATEADVIAERESPARRLCELVDGVLVEKAGCTQGSLLAAVVAHWMLNHVEQNDLGIVLGADGMLRLMPGLADPVAEYVPDLAVEVLSPSNTVGEIKRKLREYFLAGTRLAWVIQPKNQTARVYTSPSESRRISRTGSLDGAPVLPGFRVSLPDLFARTRRRRA
jgi:hypothetical protein